MFPRTTQFLMAPEGDAGGSGTAAGTTPPPPAPGAAGATPPPPPPEYMQQIQALNARLAQQEAVIQAALVGAQGQGGGNTQSSGDAGAGEDEYVDPAVLKKMAAAEKAITNRMYGVQEKLDYMQYRAEAQELGAPPEVQEAAEKLYQNWRARGLMFGDQPPSRQDALTFALGQQNKLGIVKTRGEAAAAEAARRAQNIDATVERGGRAARTPEGMDPSKMSVKERLEKYHSAVLDEDGF